MTADLTDRAIAAEARLRERDAEVERLLRVIRRFIEARNRYSATDVEKAQWLGTAWDELRAAARPEETTDGR